jgi:hypothetical protein
MTKRDDTGPKRLKDAEIINVERRQLLTGLTALGAVGAVVLTGSTAYASTQVCDAQKAVNIVLQRIAQAEAQGYGQALVPVLELKRTVVAAKIGLNASGGGSDFVTNDTDPSNPVQVGDCED